MTRFLLVVNILALTLPFLAAELQNQEQPAAAEVQNQEQSACQKNNEKLFEQKMVLFIPVHHVPNNYHHFEPNYYQQKAPVPINNLYIPYPYYAKSFVIGPHAQIPQWQVSPSVHQFTMAHHPNLHSLFMAIPTKKAQEKTTIPTSDTSATVEPTQNSPKEPAVNTVVIPETSSEFVSAPETASVPVTTTSQVTSPVASEQ